MAFKIPNPSENRRLSTVYVRFPWAERDEAAEDARRRSPRVERLLARADSSAVVADWRVDAYGCVSGAGAAPMAPSVAPVALGPAALFSRCGPVGAPWVCLATPVSYIAAMTTVRMAPGGCLSLSEAEARTLAADFNAAFLVGGQRLLAAPDGALFLSCASPLLVVTQDPVTVEGGEIGSRLPAGPDGGRLRRLMSEIEMWLHEHALNTQRSARGELRISGLWLWAGGAPLREPLPLPVWVGGRDPLLSAWSTRAVERLDGGSGIVVLQAAPGSEAWSDVEARWLEPALGELAAGRLAGLELSAGARRYRLSARWRHRWWRRSRPWWESFA